MPDSRAAGIARSASARYPVGPIIYYHCDERIPLYLLVAYSKSAVRNIRPSDKRRMVAAVEIILKRHGQ